MLDSIEQELEERGMSLEVHTALQAVPTAKRPSPDEPPPAPTAVQASRTSFSTTDVTQPAVVPSAAPAPAATAAETRTEEEEEEMSDVSDSSSDEAVERPAQRQLSVFEMAMRAFQAEKTATMRARRALAHAKPAAARRPSRKVAAAPVPRPERPVTVRAEVKPEAKAERSEKAQQQRVVAEPPKKPPPRREAAEGPVEAADSTTSGASIADSKSRSYPRPWSAHMVAQPKSTSDKAGGTERATVAGTGDSRGDIAVGEAAATSATRADDCEGVSRVEGESGNGPRAAVVTSSAEPSARRLVDGGLTGAVGTRAVRAPASGESPASGGDGEGDVDDGGGGGGGAAVGSSARLRQESVMHARDSTDVDSAAVAVRIVGASGEEVAVSGRGAGEAVSERSDESVVEDQEVVVSPPLPPPPSRRELAVAAVAARAARAVAGEESDGDDSLDEEDTRRREGDDDRGDRGGGIGWIEEDSASTHPPQPRCATLMIVSVYWRVRDRPVPKSLEIRVCIWRWVVLTSGARARRRKINRRRRRRSDVEGGPEGDPAAEADEEGGWDSDDGGYAYDDDEGEPDETDPAVAAYHYSADPGGGAAADLLQLGDFEGNYHYGDHEGVSPWGTPDHSPMPSPRGGSRQHYKKQQPTAAAAAAVGRTIQPIQARNLPLP